MKNLFIVFVVVLLAAGCNQPKKTNDTSAAKNAEMKTLYEQNLQTLQTFISDFEKEDIDGQAALIADSAIWSSPVYGDTIHTKKHWLESQKFTMDNWNNLHLSEAQFLPGIDTVKHEFDGSVRYYGMWSGTDSSGYTGTVKFYGTYDFNKDHKLISGNDFYDVDGVLNAVKSRK